jgi:exosortase
LIAAVFLWVYVPALAAMIERWSIDPRYSHGYLVPIFAGYLLWSRRALQADVSFHPSWWGVLLLLGGLATNALGTYLYVDWINALSLVVSLAGLVVLLGGRPALRWSWPAVGFLLFMMPLPFRLEGSLAAPLQRVGSVCGTFVLQTLGFTAFAEGNIIRMGEVRIGVVEACSGLSMLMIFFTLSAAVAILIRRPWWEKAVVVLSAVPIALIANITRIAVTGILHKLAGQRIADLVFHDLAGWLMMPYALGLLWAELRLIDWVMVRSPAPSATLSLAGLGIPSLAAPTDKAPRRQGGAKKKSKLCSR